MDLVVSVFFFVWFCHPYTILCAYIVNYAKFPVSFMKFKLSYVNLKKKEQ